MGTGHTGRLWLVGGALGAVVLIAVGWFFLISPQNGRTAALDSQADAARTRQVTLQHKLADLQRQNDDLAGYQAKLDSAKAALPKQADLANFLRILQTGDNSRAVVTGVAVGSPLEQTAGGAKVYALPVTVTATGSAAQLDALLDYLQQVQARAVLIKNTHLQGDSRGMLDGPGTLTVTLHVFVAALDTPPAATPAAKPS